MSAGPEEGHRETGDLAKVGPIRNSVAITRTYLIHFYWFVPNLCNLMLEVKSFGKPLKNSLNPPFEVSVFPETCAYSPLEQNVAMPLFFSQEVEGEFDFS